MKILAGMFINCLFPVSMVLVFMWLHGISVTVWMLAYTVICMRFIVSTRTSAVSGITNIRCIISEVLLMCVAMFSMLTMLLIFLVNPSATNWCPNADMLIVPFVNMRSLYNVILNKFFNFLNYCYAYFFQHLYDIKRTFCVVLYLCFQVFVAVYIIEAIGTQAVKSLSNTEDFISFLLIKQHQNYHSLVDHYTVDPVPDGKKGENVPVVLTRNIYYIGTTKTMLLDEQPLPLATKKTQISRFVGEDVKLYCHHDDTNDFEVYLSRILSRNFYWTFNGRKLRIKNDGRIHQITKYGTYGTYGTTTIGSELTILGIEKQNFGMYACVQYIVFRKSRKINRINTRTEETERFLLIEMEQFVDVTYVPLGNALEIDVYVNILNDSPVTGYYMINNIPANQVCKPDEPVCTFHLYVVSLLRSIWFLDLETFGYLLFFQFQIENGHFECQYNVNFLHLRNLYTCNFESKYYLCGSGYGWHRIYMIRELYDATRNTSKLIELLYPVEILVLPKRRNFWWSSLFPFVNNTDYYKEIAQEILNSNSSMKIEEKVLKLIRSSELNAFYFETTFNICQLVFVISIIINVCGKVFNAYIKYINDGLEKIHQLSNCSLLPTPEDTNETRRGNEGKYDYDIFVSHSEDENDWIIHTLVPLLENDLQLKVCFPDRDLEPGQRMMESYTAAICNSRMILVILSNGYINDKYKKKLQLDYIILPLIYENRLLEEDVLFIRYHPVKLERPLQWCLNLQSIDMYYLDDDCEIRRRIKEWVRARSCHLAVS